ncbi:aldehyde dehydrogenase [Bacillus songklensis]|uniref:Aldehyde dehydrogenase n=1 Tax=Bacillus songklensis TaxID=1069116 RepID=A0ABV8B3U4_9BACI
MLNVHSIIQRQRSFFAGGKTKQVEFRLEQLAKLKQSVKDREKQIIKALKQDLNKSEFESYATEIGFLYEEINMMMKHLRSWAKPEKVKTPMTHIGASSYIYPEPYGLTLIIAPWNYPFQLQLAPLVGAMAAGNCAVLKPSELTPNVSALLSELVQSTFEEEYIAVVEGGVEASQALLEEKFDYIFFTGSVAVGRIVMQAAAKHLTPVTLELGGKSPTIVDEDANLEITAKRIAWGKFTNAGQTCVAPDYLLIHKKVKEQFIRLFQTYINEFYGENPLESDQYTRIVSERHFKRLAGFLENGTAVIGGNTNAEKLMIAPTLLDGVTWDSPVMQDEIFGPILPMMEFSTLDEAIGHVQHSPNPLALYYFSESTEKQERILQSIRFGGGCMNDTLMHLANPNLPFGGVGNSGIGSYHGKSSFEVFSHQKSVLKQTTKLDPPFRYPSFKHGLSMMKKIFK